MNIEELKEELRIRINYERTRQGLAKEYNKASALSYKIAFLSLQLEMFNSLSVKEIQMLENDKYFNKYTIYDYVNGKLFEDLNQVDFFENEVNMNSNMRTLKF